MPVHRMLIRHTRFVALLTALAALAVGAAAPTPLHAQQGEPTPTIDSLIVEGNQRVSAPQILQASGLAPHRPVNYRDVQRAVTALFRSGQFDDILVEQRTLPDGRLALVFQVKERPLLLRWAVRGTQRLSEGDVKERVKLVEGRPIDRNLVQRAIAGIDSLYKRQGYYTAQVSAHEVPDGAGGVRVVFDVEEGSRVAISQLLFEGNHSFPAGELAKAMTTRPEGFWWFQKGDYDQQKVDADTRERLPSWYADHGRLDFQVLGDTLVPDTSTGKATLKLTVDEGPVYHVGRFEIEGNQRFSTEQLMGYYPFPRPGTPAADSGTVVFDRGAWDGAIDRLSNLYYNNGYIYAQIIPTVERRTGPGGAQLVDLRWTVHEGQVATVNKINIVGNDVTHERVIREAIVLLPGEVFNRELLVRSYQNVSNLGFFKQPMPPPDVGPSENGVDVDLTFRVEEKRTGTINFGASLGQGTGVGGFLGLEEPNLFGRGKRGRLQWQFGKNIRDFTLSYTDPAIRESRISATVSLFDSRVRYTIADLGRLQRTGGNLQVGFPFLGSRYTRVFGSYGLQKNSYSEGSADLQSVFQCSNCTRSTVGLSLLRDTRVGLPFPVAGMSTNISGELNGGVLGGTANYQKLDLESRWYAPLGTLGGSGQFGGGVQFVLGLTAKSGFIFGDTGPFFTELFTLGGVQYGIPLRGYDEFSITPDGYDPLAGGSNARASSFGKAFAAFTVEAGARLNQSVYLSTFFDAGNVYRSPRQYDPTRLFRGAGIGAALISPLGPIGLDLGYGFDKVDRTGKPAPGWQVHFKLGNFF
ncbi:MAG TPA: outer membrane protein assembly factor BamA [Gemmatimonadales bacterium]|nr:outer membrane protein assembly factor BamA [Gemmatimonadales bacterium]